MHSESLLILLIIQNNYKIIYNEMTLCEEKTKQNYMERAEAKALNTNN